MKYIIAYLLVFILLTGCHRDELCFMHPENALIELNIDWERSALDANSATAVIYKDGVYYSTEVFSVYPPVRKLVDLPVGYYDIVVHNDQPSDFGHCLSFSGGEGLNTFEIKTLDDTKFERGYKQPVDTLAFDQYMNLEVTPEMIGNSHIHPVSKEEAENGAMVAHSITFTPRRVFTQVSVVVNVLNGNGYYFTSRNPPLLSGMAGSYFPGGDLYSSEAVKHALTLATVPRKENSKTVTFSASQLCIGLAGRVGTETEEIKGDYALSLPFVYAGGIEMREIDLKRDAVKFRFTSENPADATNNWDRLEIEVNIELPELVLVGDMDVGVEDWTDVDIPLDGPQRLHFVANNGSSESFWRTNMPGLIINMPVPTLFTPIEGLTFVEWNTAADGTGISYQAGEVYEMKRGGAIFYAIWRKTT